MRDQKNSSSSRTHCGKKPGDLCRRLRIDIGKRFVEQQQLWRMKNGASQRQALPHALRILSHTTSERRIEPDTLHGLAQNVVGPDSVKLGEETQIFHAGEFVIQQRSVRHVSDLSAGVFRFVSEDEDFSLRWLAETGNHPQQCRLAGAVFSAQHVEARGRQRE